MAIIPETQYPGKIAQSTPEYPYGAARNITTPGDGTGTPWEAALVNDLFGFQQALLSEAAVVPSGTPDSAQDSQYLQALRKLATTSVTNYTALRALTSANLSDGSLIAVSDADTGGAFEVKSGTVTDNGGTLIVFNDNPNRYAKRLTGNGVVSAKWFGALGDESADASAAIQAALDAHAHVFVPPGTYRCDTMINLNSSKTLQLAGGATLRRTTDTTNTDPVIWVRGNSAALIGAGQTTSNIQSQNKAPKGVVLVGHWSMTESHANVVYNSLRDFGITGQNSQGQTTGDPDTALMIQNPQLGGLVVYFQTITGLRVSNANYGIWLRGWANGNTISNIQGYRLGDETVNGGAMVFDNGGLDNSFVGAFFHQSANSIGLKMEELDNTANGGAVHTTYATSYSNFVCEQGGASARGIFANDGTVSSCFFDVRHNTDGGNVLDSGFNDRNTFFGLGSYRTTVKALAANPKELSFLNDDDSEVLVRERGYRLTGMGENTYYKLLTVADSTSSNNTLVELTIADAWGSVITTNQGEKALFAINRNGARTTTVQLLEHNKMGGSSLGKGLVIPDVSGNTVTFSYRTGNNGTATTNQSVRVMARVIGSGSTTYHQSLEAGIAATVIRGGDQIKYFDNQVLASTDNTYSLGAASNRWSEVFAGNGTINTSDEREKTEFETLTDKEVAVGLELKGLIGKFQWVEAVDRKGDAARVHFGIGAQTVGKTFEKHGLDPHKYGVFCFDEWYLKDGVPVDKDEEGAEYHSRYGVRYDQLFALILAAM